MEKWRDVVGFERFYQVSDLGRVRSLARTVMVPHASGVPYAKPIRERIMKPLRGAGTMYVNLNPGPVTRKVHHLVLEAFVGPRPEGTVTRHLDGNFANNRLPNIIYGSQSSNRLDSTAHGRHRVPRAHVEAIRAEEGSQRELARRYGVSRTYVRLVRAGRTRTTG